MTFPALPLGWQPPLPTAGGQAPSAGQAGVLAGRGCVRTRRCSLPPAHSPFFLKKARSEERFLPMKTTMVAGERVWSPQEQGLHRPPRRLCLLCRGGSHPAVCRQGGCRRPPATSLRPHPHGERMLDRAKRLRCSCPHAGRSLSPGTVAQRQEGTAPAAPTALLGHGRMRAGAPPLASRLTPGPPASSHAWHGPQGSVLLGSGPGFPQLPPLAPLGPPPAPSSPAPRWAQHPCKPVARFHNSAANWEEPGGFSSSERQSLGYGTAQPTVPAFPPPRRSPVPPRTWRPPQPPQPCQGEPHSRHSSARSGGTRAIAGQRAFVLRDGASSMATSWSQEPAVLGENKVSDQSNQ